MHDEDRTITDADARKIAEELKDLFAEEFKLGVGSAVIQWVRKLLWTLLIFAVAYGSAHPNTATRFFQEGQ